VPTKFVNKFAKKIDRSTDKFGFLGHSNKFSHVPFFAYHLKNQWNHLNSQCLDWAKKHLSHGQNQHVLAVWQRQQWRSSSGSLGSRGRPFGGQH
jgi:hypothetical protein